MFGLSDEVFKKLMVCGFLVEHVLKKIDLLAFHVVLHILRNVMLKLNFLQHNVKVALLHVNKQNER